MQRVLHSTKESLRALLPAIQRGLHRFPRSRELIRRFAAETGVWEPGRLAAKMALHEMLLQNRRDSVDEGLTTRSERWSFKVWKKAMLSRKMMNKGGAKAKNFMLQNFFKKTWGNRRELPKVADQSFNEWWRARMKK